MENNLKKMEHTPTIEEVRKKAEYAATMYAHDFKNHECATDFINVRENAENDFLAGVEWASIETERLRQELEKWKGIAEYGKEGWDKCQQGKANTQQGWISVKDGLPKKEGSYLVSSGIGLEVSRFKYGKFYYSYTVNLSEGVTHWMPLPEKP